MPTPEEKVAERHRERMRERMAGLNDDPPEDPKPGEIEIEDPPELDDDPIDDERPSRAERRRQRGREHEDLVNERAARAAADARASALAAELAAERAQARQAPPKPDTDPIDAELDRVYADQETLLAAWNAADHKTMTEAQRQDFQRKSRKLEIDKGVLIAKKAGAGRQPEQEDPRVAYNRSLDMQTGAKFPDVYGNQNARNWATLQLQMYLQEGRPNDAETWAAACDAARAKFKTAPPRREITRSDQRAHSSAPRGMGAGGAPASPRRVDVSDPAVRNMAIRAFGNRIDPKTGRKVTEQQAIQLWANKVGPKLLERKQQG